MSCLDFDTLVAYWLGEPPGSDAPGAPAATPEAVEEHLFGCAACVVRLETVEAVVAAVRARGPDGHVSTVLPGALMNRLARDGVHVRTYTLRPGEVVPCAVAAGDDLLVARLTGDFSGAGRLDVTIAAGPLMERIRDVPVNRAHGEICIGETGDRVRTWPTMRLVFRVLDVGAGGERTLGEYVLEHHAA
jgi:hypothetical protein